MGLSASGDIGGFDHRRKKRRKEGNIPTVVQSSVLSGSSMAKYSTVQGNEKVCKTFKVMSKDS
jgi:hypothetical protein